MHTFLVNLSSLWLRVGQYKQNVNVFFTHFLLISDFKRMLVPKWHEEHNNFFSVFFFLVIISWWQYHNSGLYIFKLLFSSSEILIFQLQRIEYNLFSWERTYLTFLRAWYLMKKFSPSLLDLEVYRKCFSYILVPKCRIRYSDLIHTKYHSSVLWRYQC